MDAALCKVSAAARIDVAGGWSDTPPITYEFGGAVLNIAIKVDGQVSLIDNLVSLLLLYDNNFVNGSLIF